MKNQNLWIFYSIINLIYFWKSYSLKCGEEVIENCEKCGDKTNTCIKCKDKHFLFFNNLYCLPCNEPEYGDEGCIGDCDASNYLNDRHIICKENDCKEGLYNYNGKCLNCSEFLPNCKKCSYSVGKYNQILYNCIECLSNNNIIDSYAECHSCNIYHCKKCHFNSVESFDPECDECDKGYYVNNNKECSECNYNYISNGICFTYPDNEYNNDFEICYCDPYYTIYRDSICIECPKNCSDCQYNNEINKTECINCEAGFALNSEKKCIFCGDGCEACSLINDSIPNCTLCFYNKYQPKNNKCLICPDNCQNCEHDENDKIKCIKCKLGNALLSNGTCQECSNNCYNCSSENDIVTCSQCYDNYILSPKNECIDCSNINQTGMEGCERCGYNNETEKYECYECKQIYYKNEYESNNRYTYLNNNFQCLNYENITQLSLNGCFEAYYNETTGEYECIICNEYSIMIINEKKCKSNYEVNLTNCYEVQNIGDKGSPKYSCHKCYENFIKIKSKDNIINCFKRENELAHCLEGEIDDFNNINCTKCIPRAKIKINGNNSICQCDSDSFGSNDGCYKCNDEIFGIAGCDKEKGCNYNYYDYQYYQYYQLECNQCKDGYYKNYQNTCYPCSNEIYNCKNCHFDYLIEKVVCDKCFEGFKYNSQYKICELNKCEDYPEICEGCLICDGNPEEYISNNKCQLCRPGYFKTKDEQCIYCRLEKYGGPACNKCKYETNENGDETDNINCEICSQDYYNLLSADGKCYNCQDSFSDCDECEFIKNKDNIEHLKCTLCKPGYYLDSEGKCINYLHYIKEIANCGKYSYKINNITFCTSLNDYSEDKKKYQNTFYCHGENYNYNYSDYYGYSDYYDYYENYDSYFKYKQIYNISSNFIIPIINTSIEAQCIQCLYDYNLDFQGNCVKIPIEYCSLTSIINNFPKRYKNCEKLCNNYPYINVDLTYTQKLQNNNYSEILDIRSIFELYYEYYDESIEKMDISKEFENLTSFIANRYLCIPRNNTFDNCLNAKYEENNNRYICNKCYNNLILDINSNICKYDKIFENCIVENIGTDLNPIYSCKKCVNNYYTLISENNVKYCIYNEKEEIHSCIEANVDTTYVNTIYNCSKCLKDFFPYYSKFFGRKICQYIFGTIITKKDISLENYENIESVKAIKGICPKKNLFTPDGEKCYQCNNKVIGMPGCKGACSFSLERYNSLKCEGECKKGYIETSEGICEPCGSVNPGCYECHYENGYPSDYLGIKRKRRFICDFCETGYFLSEGNCLTNEDIDIDKDSYCEEIKIDPKNNNQYICTKCNEFSVLYDGECEPCLDTEFKINNQCYECDQFNNGGIKGCLDCERNNNNQLICQRCLPGYILLKNNNTCLNLSENKELEKFKYCEQLTLDNKQLYCSKCKEEYSLLIENNDKGKCTKIPSLYDSDYKYDYNSYSNYEYYPCQESINIGTKDKPIYSCIKCYQLFEFEKSLISPKTFNTRIINKRNNISFCIYQEIENCTEAIYENEDGVIKYDCLKCIDGNELIYDSKEEMHYCEYIINITKKCSIKYCKKCKSNNNYFCDECLLPNYEVNNLTGSCVEKTELIPSIIWKDIFRLKMNSEKMINGQTYYGPSILLRGITNSQINENHAFLIYLIFKIKTEKKRLLEEKKIPAICQVINDIDEIINDVNIIEYECIANTTEIDDLSNYQLEDIDEGQNDGLLKKSNLKELASQKKYHNFIKDEPEFTIEQLLGEVIFEMNEINNYTANNYIFDFKIDGILNKEINQGIFKGELDLNEIEEKANCSFVIEKNKNANLNCTINIENYKNINVITFKPSEINTNGNQIYLSKLDQILLINNYEEEKEEEEKEEEEKKKEKNYTVIIILCIVAGVSLIGGITTLIIYQVKKDKNKNQINESENKYKEKKKDVHSKVTKLEKISESKDFVIQ